MIASHVLDEMSGALDGGADADLEDSSRASSAVMSRPVTRGTNETRPQSSGSAFVDDDAFQYDLGGSISSELSASVKRLVGAAKERFVSSSSSNMEAIVQLYEQTKISTAEAQKNPSCA